MTANGWASEPVPAVVGTATIGRPGASVGPSYSISQIGMSLAARSAIALAASIADPPPSATTTVPCSPTARSVVAPSSTVAPDGFGSTSLNIVAAIEAASRTSSASAATPATTTPGSVTRKARAPPAAATSSGSRRSAPTPNTTRLRSVISSSRSARPVTAAPRAPGRGSCRDGRSASADSRRRGTSARSSRHRGSRTPRPRRNRAHPGR